jgi:hypothetical protein
MTSMQPPSGGLTVVKRQPISERANVLDVSVDRLDEALRHLIDRLEPVLGPSQPSPSDEGATPGRGDESWLAGYLQHVTAKVDELGSTVHRITARIEL